MVVDGNNVLVHMSVGIYLDLLVWVKWAIRNVYPEILTWQQKAPGYFDTRRSSGLR